MYLVTFLSTKADSLFAEVSKPTNTDELKLTNVSKQILESLIETAVIQYLDQKLDNDEILKEYVTNKNAKTPDNSTIENDLLQFINGAIDGNGENPYRVLIERMEEVSTKRTSGGKRKSLRTRKNGKNKKSRKNRRRSNRRRHTS